MNKSVDVTLSSNYFITWVSSDPFPRLLNLSFKENQGDFYYKEPSAFLTLTVDGEHGSNFLWSSGKI